MSFHKNTCKYLKALMLHLLLFLVVSLNGAVKFNNINDKYGLSMREGNSICKDHDGFIWASHKTGILRLTNDNYKIYHLSNEIKDYLTIKLVYSDSLLVAYTNNGQVFQYNSIFDKFELVYSLKIILDKKFLYLTYVYISDGYLWITTSSGVYKAAKNEIQTIENISSNPQRITAFSKHRIIIACENDISILNTLNDSIEKVLPFPDTFLTRVSSLQFLPKKQQLLIGTISDGLYIYSFQNDTSILLHSDDLPKQPILDIEISSDSSVYLGIDGQGMWEINTNNFSILNIYRENIDNPSSLKGNGVYDIFNDNNKRIWVSTYSNGISYFEKTSPIIETITHQINNPNSLSNNNVNSIVEDRSGKLWFGTNNGFCSWDIKKNKWKKYYTDNSTKAQVFLALCEDVNNNIWAGTYASGVYVIDEISGREVKHYSTQGKQSLFSADFVLDIFEDRDNNLWIGGVHGFISKYLIDENRFIIYGESPLNGFDQLSDYEILKACTYGLSIINLYTSNSSIILDGYVVNDVCIIDSIIWACTSGDGLVKFNHHNNELKKFSIEEGVPSNYINSIIRVKNDLWLGTEHGICRFNLEDNSIETFNGIPSLSNLSLNRNATCRLKDNRIAWGTNNGVVIFDPENLAPSSSTGKIFIEDIAILGRSIKTSEKFKLKEPVNNIERLQLAYHQNAIAIELLTIGISPNSKFCWKMDGFDEDWNIPSNHRLITYSKLPSKTMQLRIRLLDNTLNEIIDERVINIKVKPPFWGTWYFFLISFIVFSTIIYFSLWYYINQLKQKHNEEKISFFTNTAHDIRTSLTLIKGPVEELNKEESISETAKYYLKLAKDQTGRLSDVVTQLMDFQKIDTGRSQLVIANTDIVQLIRNRINVFDSYAESKNISIVFHSQSEKLITAIDESKLEKVLDNLISNAIKYSNPFTEIKIKLSFDHKAWNLKIKDRGIGISKADQQNLFNAFYRGENAINKKIVGSGIGLLMVRNYVKLHSGKIDYLENPEGGSIFIISIPVKIIESSNEDRKLEDYELIDNSSISLNSIKAKDPKNRASKIKVLIVEDNDDLRGFMKHALGSEYKILEAEDGKLAIDKVRDHSPDLIISDIMMPNMNGFELCERMKSDIESSHIPILLLSALDGKAEKLNGLGLGADDYLTKPFDVDLLKHKIESIIKNRNAIREQVLRVIDGDEDEPVLNNTLNEDFLKQMIRVMNNNIDNERFNKNAFAEALNISSSLLYKKAKAITGQSPTDFIRIVRLKESIKLLKTKKYSILEVSEKCGFSSPTYFSTTFKKYIGKAPKDFSNQ